MAERVTLEFKTINDPLLELKGDVLIALQAPPETVIKVLARIFIVTGFADLRACKCLTGDGPHTTEFKHPGQAELIARTTMELVSNYLFIAQNPIGRFKWYKRAGWIDLKEKYDTYAKAYSSNPEFTKTLEVLKRAMDEIQYREKISDHEAAQIAYFPNLSGMLRFRGKDNPHSLPPKVYNFLAYLDSWMYGEYSQNAHNRYQGITNRIAYDHISLRGLVTPTPHPDYREIINSNAVYRPFIFVLMLLSEAIATNEYNEFKPRAQLIWEKLIDPYWEVKEIWDLRYQELLRI